MPALGWALGGGDSVAERYHRTCGGHDFVGMDGVAAGGGASGTLILSPATWVFVALQPVDMWAGSTHLYAHVETRLNQDPP